MSTTLFPEVETHSKCLKLALQYARRMARAEGISLGRFQLTEFSNAADSMLGMEWHANGLRSSTAVVMVWKPLGEYNINEALRNCTICRSFGGIIFGISIRDGKR